MSSVKPLLKDHLEHQEVMDLLLAQDIVGDDIEEVLELRWYQLSAARKVGLNNWFGRVMRLQRFLLVRLHEVARSPEEEQYRLVDEIHVPRRAAEGLQRLRAAGSYDGRLETFLSLKPSAWTGIDGTREEWLAIEQLQNELALRLAWRRRETFFPADDLLCEFSSSAERAFIQSLINDDWLSDSMDEFLQLGPELQHVRWIGENGWLEIKELQGRLRNRDVKGLDVPSSNPVPAINELPEPMAVVNVDSNTPVNVDSKTPVVKLTRDELALRYPQPLSEVLIVHDEDFHILEALFSGGLVDGSVGSFLGIRQSQLLALGSLKEWEIAAVTGWQAIVRERLGLDMEVVEVLSPLALPDEDIGEDKEEPLESTEEGGSVPEKEVRDAEAGVPSACVDTGFIPEHVGEEAEPVRGVVPHEIVKQTIGGTDPGLESDQDPDSPPTPVEWGTELVESVSPSAEEDARLMESGAFSGLDEALLALPMQRILTVDEKHILERLTRHGLFDGTVGSLLAIREEEVMALRKMGVKKWSQISSWQKIVRERLFRDGSAAGTLGLDDIPDEQMQPVERDLCDRLVDEGIIDCTVRSILYLSMDEFLSVEYFGANKWKKFEEFRTRLISALKPDSHSEILAQRTSCLAEEDLNRPISTLYHWGRGSGRLNLWRKLERLLAEGAIRDRVGDFLALERAQALAVGSIGKETLKHEFPRSRRHIERVLAPTNIPDSFIDLEKILLCGLRSALAKSSNRDRGFVLKRLGVGCEKYKLQQVADVTGVTRERVRQIQVKFALKFPFSMKVHPERVWPLMAGKFAEELAEEMPTLRSLFQDLACFSGFLELAGGFEKRILCFADIDLISVLRESGYRKQSVFMQELMTRFHLSERIVQRILNQACVQGKIRISGGFVLLESLPMDRKVEWLLECFPRGLTRLDLDQLVQSVLAMEGGDEQIRGILNRDNDAITLKGTYRQSSIYGHEKYLELDDKAVATVGAQVAEYLEQSDHNSVRLERLMKDLLLDFQPETVEHMLRKRAEEFGLVWKGKSRARTIGLAGTAKRVNLDEYVFRIVAKSPNGLTADECARRMHHRAHYYVNMILQRLATAGRLFRVERGAYMSDKAFLKHMKPSFKTIRKRTRACLKEAGSRAVYIPYIRMLLQREDELHCSSEQVRSICRLLEKDGEPVALNGWLIGTEPPRWGQLSEVFHWAGDNANEDLMGAVRGQVIASHQALQRANSNHKADTHD